MCKNKNYIAVFILGLRLFLCHITGAEFPERKTIHVDLIGPSEADEYGAIVAHTCTNEISLPRGVFKEYAIFEQSFKAVLGGPPSFNVY